MWLRKFVAQIIQSVLQGICTIATLKDHFCFLYSLLDLIEHKRENNQTTVNKIVLKYF